MTPTLVDSGAFFANIVAEDEAHDAASAIFRTALDEGWSLITTNAIVFETHALLVNKARNGRVLGRRFLDAVSAGMCRVERVTVDDELAADALLRQHADKDWSFCDALSFVVTRRRKIKRAISFDGDFREYGKLTILP